MDKILTIDIGGSKIIVGLADFCGNILQYEKFKLPEKYDIDFLIDKICKMAENYMSEKPVVAGVTIPGLADAEKGMWLYAPFSGISNFNICEILGQRLGIKVFCDNDVNACARAERRFGICKSTDNFLWITVSNGIGGAVFINGQIVYGDNQGAGEIGHFIVEENTENVCGCGKCGCLEAMASGRGITKEYKNLTGKTLSAQDIANLAKSGDKDAIDVYYRAGFYIGKAVSYCVNLLNIEKTVIGGGVSNDIELLDRGIQDALEKYLFVSANKNTVVKKTGLGYLAALLGSASVAMEGEGYV